MICKDGFSPCLITLNATGTSNNRPKDQFSAGFENEETAPVPSCDCSLWRSDRSVSSRTQADFPEFVWRGEWQASAWQRCWSERRGVFNRREKWTSLNEMLLLSVLSERIKWEGRGWTLWSDKWQSQDTGGGCASKEDGGVIVRGDTTSIQSWQRYMFYLKCCFHRDRAFFGGRREMSLMGEEWPDGLSALLSPSSDSAWVTWLAALSLLPKKLWGSFTQDVICNRVFKTVNLPASMKADFYILNLYDWGRGLFQTHPGFWYRVASK